MHIFNLKFSSLPDAGDNVLVREGYADSHLVLLLLAVEVMR
ncbi:unnamed protein product [Brassica rapa subsp. trilocularis]